ncbi:response regulator [Bacillus altitudinis]|uniref:response regulator n=1 Tax=Bacillus altitudinis TaxID=293387 RepID=UPI0015691924|nr:response regulator [Bacillus altitudinis]MCY7455161.1 response regulator [Bacillus altitudinis]MCY7620557.1 response regulator [Bacillus altitudinis]MDI6560910.1 response regulator [Bacillus altitudinis]MED0850498.1 response regulator [Bacillus altitudinis]QKJ38911.1 DNA-binding domain-containing protein [Bacillus altitudinis]
MRFFIADDDRAIRSILGQIIEDEDLGEVVDEADDGIGLEAHSLNLKKVDILLIDLLMPARDGIQTIRHIHPEFKGKVIMISQVEAKEMMAEAYELGIEYYIHKPVNRIEIVSVIRKVMERIKLEKSIYDIQASLRHVLPLEPVISHETGTGSKRRTMKEAGEFLLSELGIVGESGSKDLLEILIYLHETQTANSHEVNFPPLKQLFIKTAERKLGRGAADVEVMREVKAAEQRIRRAIHHSLNHFASLGLTDFSNPKFEHYASKFFDFTDVSQRMKEMQKTSSPTGSTGRVNTKKFVQIFYFEAKQLFEGMS